MSSIFAAPGTTAEDYRQGRLSEERHKFGMRTEWAPSRIAWLFRHAAGMTGGDPLQTTRLLENLRRECRDNQSAMALALLERGSSWSSRVYNGTGQNIVVTLPVGVEARIRDDPGYWPGTERIDSYDNLDGALILWRHARGPAHKNQTCGRILATDRSRLDPRVYIKISDNCPDIIELARFSEIGASIGFTSPDIQRIESRRGVLEIVGTAEVGEISLCHKREAAYDLKVEFGIPRQELQTRHQAAMQPANPGPLHLRRATHGPRLISSGTMVPGGTPVMYPS